MSRIMIDIDGVIANFSKTFSGLAKNLGYTDTIVNDYDQKEWNYDFDDKPVWEAWKKSYNPWMTLEPSIMKSEIKLLNEVINVHDIYFITTRPRTKGFSAELQSHYWLNSIGVNADKTSVIATKAGTKGALCSALDIEIAIDDKAENVLDIRNHGIYCGVRHMLHNRHVDNPRYYYFHEFLSDIPHIGYMLKKG